MGNKASGLKAAISGLKINQPFDLRGKEKFKPELQKQYPESRYTESEYTQTEYTEKKPTQSKRPSGYFMLSLEVFSDDRVRELSGDIFKVFLLLSVQAWRYQDSKGEARASVGYLSEGTGLARSTVVRALTYLREARLITLLDTDQRKGNLWRVLPIANRKERFPESRHTENEYTQTEHTQNRTPLDSNSGMSQPKIGTHYTEIEYKVLNPNKILLNSHSSATGAREELENYLKTLKPERKKAQEREAFASLRKGFGDEEIAKALAWVQKHGTLRDKQPCHSPMGYLAVAMQEVLQEIREGDCKLEKLKAWTLDSEQELQLEMAIVTAEQVELDECEARFRKLYPTKEAQKAYLCELAKRLPGLDPEGPVVKGMAIQEQLKRNARQ